MNETMGGESAAEARHGEEEWREQHVGAVEPSFVGDVIEFAGADGAVYEGYSGADQKATLEYGKIEHTPPEISEILLDVSDYETEVATAESTGQESILKEALDRYKNAQTKEEKEMIFENELKPLREIEKSLKGTM